MKTRNGFVSNSSSSSFVVIITDNKRIPEERKKGPYITEEQKQKLLDYGFVYCITTDPMVVEKTPKAHWKSKEDNNILAYNVTCNEDEVIEFLVKNNISFSAVRHYGHTSVFYKKDADRILFMDNLGQAFEMYEWKISGYSEEDLNRFLINRSTESPIRTVFKERFLKKTQSYYRDYEKMIEDEDGDK